MKLFKFVITLVSALSCSLIYTTYAHSQSGNQSDITGPNPIEISPTNNQSDITGPSPNEMIPLTTDETIPVLTDRATPTQAADRSAYEQQLVNLDFISAIKLQEEYQASVFSQYWQIDLRGQPPSPDRIAKILGQLWQATGQKTALIYVSPQAKQLETFTIFPLALEKAKNTENSSIGNKSEETDIEKVFLRQTIPGVTREQLLRVAQEFRAQVTNSRRPKGYVRSSQKLYEWLIEPTKAALETNKIDTIVFALDSGLRILPIAALYDGKQFLIEKYGMAIIPSFGLTDVSYKNIQRIPILAMGASQFSNQNPLPAVPIELETITKETLANKYFINEEFTLSNFIDRNKEKQFGLIHLATHGEFRPGEAENSYIEFFDRRLTLPEFRQLANQLDWLAPQISPIELLVLSACKTAVGDEGVELGFAGLAVGAGVKSAVASLWYVSDWGTLGLMSEFYRQLEETPLKAQALRQTQLAMLKKQVRVENDRLFLSDGSSVPLPPELATITNLDLSHPYFWSAFTLIGNWN